MAQGTKKKSRLWSLKEIKKVADIVESAIASGKDKRTAYDEAATYFGVTRNAIHIRYGRYMKGESMTRVKRNTTKTSTKGVIRGPYKKKRKYTRRNGVKPGPKPKMNYSPVIKALSKRIIDESNRIVLPIALLGAAIPRVMAVTIDFDTRSVTYTY